MGQRRRIHTIEPKFATPERSSKLDPFAETLAGWLKTNAKKGRKDRHTLKKMRMRRFRPIDFAIAARLSTACFAL